MRATRIFGIRWQCSQWRRMYNFVGGQLIVTFILDDLINRVGIANCHFNGAKRKCRVTNANLDPHWDSLLLQLYFSSPFTGTAKSVIDLESRSAFAYVMISAKNLSLIDSKFNRIMKNVGHSISEFKKSSEQSLNDSMIKHLPFWVLQFSLEPPP